VFFVSTFLGTFLPASVGGDAVRAFGLARLRVSPGPAVASVLMDRLLGILSIVLVGLAGLFAIDANDPVSSRAIEISLLVTSLACLAGALVVFSERAARLAEAIAQRLPLTVLKKLGGDLATATRSYARYHRELTRVFAGSVAVQVLRVLQAFCLGRALAIAAPLSAYFSFLPLILLVTLLPVSVNGLGTSQFAFVWFFGRAGVPEADAFALSILFLALGVLGNLPGGFLYAFSHPRR
jgi:uncharacterized protein (TIRG00374 family)